MASDPRLDELLDLWEERRHSGANVQPSELCADCPQLAEEFGRRIDIILKGERALRAAPPGEPTVAPSGLHAPVSSPGSIFGDYEILDELGRGAMGVVYRARARANGHLVALKVMQYADAASLRRFQHEFRTMQEVAHPNLVTLYQAVQETQPWFFTMELVEGADFLTHVRGGAPDELRSALRQLAEGLQALHEKHILHRDLKPSNVLVTCAGQVKVLDFGLAADLGKDGHHHSTVAAVRGTFAYMSPEQGEAEHLTAASDWYSVGVMLFEALTGRLPFQGSFLQMQERRRSADLLVVPVAPGRAPDDLERLCLDLLRRSPHDRPSGPEVLARLGALPRLPVAATTFLGREVQLASMQDALTSVRQRHGATVLVVHGNSGTGKTALVEHFLDRVRARQEALVLAGRCYERVSVPYKALDSLIDTLTHHLGELGPRAEDVLPLDLAPLLRVFPVLAHVPVVAAASRAPLDAPEPQELRRRAFAGLRDLLARLGRKRPLLLAIDDLQWGDVDSALLLADLLAPPLPPRLLLLCCYRDEDEGRSAFLQEFARVRDQSRAVIDWRDIPVAALAPTVAEQLARQLLGADSANAARANALADEAGGNPFLLCRLAQASRQGRGLATMEGMIAAQLAALPADQRRLLEVVAVSGRPLDVGTACRAAALDVNPWVAMLGLQREQLTRGTGAAGTQEIETYHDRIRTAVVATLSPEVLRRLHCQLAAALREGAGADPEALATHFEQGGLPAAAALHYTEAAAQAVQSLAFDRAVRLYQRAVNLLPADDPSAAELHARRGAALVCAGRSCAAAEAYLAAAECVGSGADLEWRRHAFEQFLRSGHIERGRRELRTVLAAVGMKLPETPTEGFQMLLADRERLWVSGMRRCRERPAAELPAAVLLRLDICWSAYLVLSMIDHMLGSAFHTRHLLLALRAGEPYRLALALAAEGSQLAVHGRRGARRATALLRQALALAERLPSEEDRARARAQVVCRCGATASLLGRWREAKERCREAEELFGKVGWGVAFEIGTVEYLAFLAQSRLGEWKDMAGRLPERLRRAQERDDRYTTNWLLIQSAHCHLAADDPDQARAALRFAREIWPGERFDLQRYFNGMRCIEVALYCGDRAEAKRLMSGYWPELKQSRQLRWHAARIFSHDLRGRHALLQAVGSPARAGRLLRVVERAADRVEKDRMPYGTALAGLLRAGAAAVRGDGAGALRHLESAEAAATAADMALHVAVAQRRRGELLGGEKGRALVSAADAWMAGQDIRRPDRITAMFAPGFPS